MATTPPPHRHPSPATASTPASPPAATTGTTSITGAITATTGTITTGTATGAAATGTRATGTAVPGEPDGHDAGYRGPAVLEVDGQERPVEVALRGTFQPVDGLYHWYGRIVGDPELVELFGGRRLAAVLRTPQGRARGELSDPDPWHRYRITGTSTPPFRVPGPTDPPAVA